MFKICLVDDLKLWFDGAAVESSFGAGYLHVEAGNDVEEFFSGEHLVVPFDASDFASGRLCDGVGSVKAERHASGASDLVLLASLDQPSKNYAGESARRAMADKLSYDFWFLYLLNQSGDD